VSTPFPGQNLTASDMVWLRMDQALADYASILTHFKAVELPGTDATITLGGSYGGTLSALMRVKYPEIVTGSVASAGPSVLYLDNGPMWYDSVASIYEMQDPPCKAAVQMAFNHVNASLGDPHLKDRLKLCRPVVTAWDGYLLQSYLRQAVVDAAQFNFDHPGAYTFPNPFEAVCRRFKTAQSDSERDSALVYTMSILYNKSGTHSCFAYDGKGADETHMRPQLEYRQHTWTSLTKSPVGIEDIPWSWQTCVEFVINMGMGLTGQRFFHMPTLDPLGRTASEAKRAFCEQRWGVQPDGIRPYAVNNTMLAASSNIFFSNFGFDPVHFISPNVSLGPALPAAVVSDGGHCEDLFLSQGEVKESVLKLQDEEFRAISQWLASARASLAGKPPGA